VHDNRALNGGAQGLVGRAAFVAAAISSLYDEQQNSLSLETPSPVLQSGAGRNFGDEL
jgi:hypothetical protein